MTDLIGAPAAAAKVRLSWKLIPQSACPAVSRVSGAVSVYGITLRPTDDDAYQPLSCATKKPVWFVFGVQSSANRTISTGGLVPGGTAEGKGPAVDDGDAGDVDA